jgi:hypothetical protein
VVTPKPTSNPRNTPRPTKQPTTYTRPDIVTTQIDARGLVYLLKDGFEYGLDGSFPWHTSTDNPWSLVEDDQTEGSFSVRSHPVEAGETSDLHIAIKSDHGGVLYFDFKTDVKMPFHGCYINIDDESKKGYTYPKEDWIEMGLPVPEGEHVVMFRAWAPNLGKPDQAPAGISGTIGVDNVSYMPNVKETFDGGKISYEAFTFEGSAAWQFDWNRKKEGRASLRSPVLNSVGSAYMRLEIDVPRRGSTLSFWYLGSVRMPWDSFKFSIDGQVVLWVKDNEEDWVQFTRVLPPGRYILEWQYVKEGSSSHQTHPGLGGVWLDEIVVAGKS